jgi:Ni,Fe-hydrogenase III large subunit
LDSPAFMAIDCICGNGSDGRWFLMTVAIPYIYNGDSIPMDNLPVVGEAAFHQSVAELVENGCHLTAMLAMPRGNKFLILAVLGVSKQEQIGLIATEAVDEYTSVTPDCPAAQGFEREIFEQWGLRPKGHPWLKPIRFQPSLITGKARPIGDADFLSMTGEDIHEVAVGPVHAGVIEPGHFRFQCHGETVYHLEISLGYQHRGVERFLVGGPDKRTIHYMETLAGDSTIGHMTAYCGALEALAGLAPSPTAQSIRAIAAELERTANHIGDLGALAGDVGFLPTMNYCGRIRGDVLNLTAMICGNRFGRGLLTPGGVQFHLDADLRRQLTDRLHAVEADLRSAVPLMFDAPSVQARFEGTGALSAHMAGEIGLTGVAARACGLEMDVRIQFPYGAYRFDTVPICVYDTGDCLARAYVRWLEVEQSIDFIRRQLKTPGPENEPLPRNSVPAPHRLAVSLAEGWRGQICHVAATDAQGRFAVYKVVDPSFYNWFGLAQALRGQQISDFPLCNKSFNLSYCGHDL